ncbi:MAG: RpiB/LacA/LacB family sugar-phosphate isomerase [Bacilli bacterium]|nr:RpiB/LacA/LacB family sugar-phosphate isomerase [bacterium]MDY5992855.1 RpiB/LacA/LacB family sugar-phosphate isomerase [Bacilli bacterium]
MKIGFASDHRGYKLKKELINELKKENYEIIDYGTDSEESTDYPDYAFKLGENVAKKNVDFGVAICGSGIGISIACNKVKGIRCAKVSNKEEAEVTRIDNDSNIVAFGEKTSFDEAVAIVKTFINTESSDLEKHKRRINKIKEYEETH